MGPEMDFGIKKEQSYCAVYVKVWPIEQVMKMALGSLISVIRATSALALFLLVVPETFARVDCLDAPPLADPEGNVINVSTSAELLRQVRNAAAGTTLLINPGVYKLSSTLYVRQNNITLRGNSSTCDAVRLVGQGMENKDYGEVPHGIWTDASGLVVQNLSISDVYYHGIIYNPGAESPVIYNVRLENTGQQFVKANPTSFSNGVDKGVVEYSIFEYTEGPPETDHGGGTGYTNGVDIHAGVDWSIRNNVFIGFHTPDTSTNLWNPAILMWNGASNTIVENNIFVDVDRAVAFGLVDRANDHSGGIIRNNMIFYSPNLYSAARRTESDGAIIVWDSPGTQVYHNTILTNGNLNKSIEFRFNTTGAEAVNNLLDAMIGQRDGGTYFSSGNAFNSKIDWFTDPSVGDMHLRPQVLNEIQQVEGAKTAPRDFDNQLRNINGLVFPGADEPLLISPPQPPSNVRAD